MERKMMRRYLRKTLSKRVIAFALSFALIMPQSVFTYAVTDDAQSIKEEASLSDEEAGKSPSQTPLSETKEDAGEAPAKSPEMPGDEPEATSTPTPTPTPNEEIAEGENEESSPAATSSVTPAESETPIESESPTQSETPTPSPTDEDATPTPSPAEAEATATPTDEEGVTPTPTPSETPEAILESSEDKLPLGEKELPDLLKDKVLDHKPSGMTPEKVSYCNMVSTFDTLPSAYTASGNTASGQAAVKNPYISTVRDQGKYNNCWSFAITGTAETAYAKLKGLSASEIAGLNLAELHMVNFLYNYDGYGNSPEIKLYTKTGNITGDRTINCQETKAGSGSNNIFTMFMLARWSGVADENSYAPYHHPTVEEYGDDASAWPTSLDYISPSKVNDSVEHLENGYFFWVEMEKDENGDMVISNRADLNVVKQAIYDYGSVDASIGYDSSYDGTYYKYYTGRDFPEGQEPGFYYFDGAYTNHEISLVGWDDTYDKNNFAYSLANAKRVEAGEDPIIPKENGAWLLKNSWGSSYSTNGFVWISYEDQSLNGEPFIFYDYGPVDNYDYNYQYDGSTGIARIYGDEELKGAAIYTATSAQELKAVGVGVGKPNTDVTVTIYKNIQDMDDPESGQSGTYEVTTQKHADLMGFYTVELPSSVQLDEGETFSIVVHMEGTSEDDPQVGFFVDASCDNGWIRFEAVSNSNETYLYQENEWCDAANKNYTLRIKGYTDDMTYTPGSSLDFTRDMIGISKEYTYTGKDQLSDVINNITVSVLDGAQIKSLEKDVDYTVTVLNGNSENVTELINPGEYSIKVTGIGTYVGKEATKQFTVQRKPISKEMIVTTSLPYDGTDISQRLTITDPDNPEKTFNVDDFTYTEAVVPGKYTYTITVDENKLLEYTGEATKEITITKAVVSAELFDVYLDGVLASSYNAEYTGAAIVPSVTLKNKEGETLNSSYYTVAFKNNVKAGTASLIVTGKGLLSGKVIETFTISPADASAAVVNHKDAVYSGKMVAPTVASVVLGTRTLKKGTDYTVSVTGGINAGVLSNAITVTFKGNYTGTITKDAEIKPAAPPKTVTAVIDATYKVVSVYVSGMLIEPEYYDVQLFKAGYRQSEASKITLAEIEAGAKYDVLLSFNQVGSGALVSGDYVGNKLITNQIARSNFGTLNIEFVTDVSNIVYDGKAKKPAIVVKNSDNEVVSKTLYTVTYFNNVNAGSAYVKVDIKGTKTRIATKEFQIKKRTILPANIPSIKAQTYTGNAIKPVVTIRGLKAADISLSYIGDNINAGDTAKVRLTLVNGNYQFEGGNNTTDIGFNIVPATITSVKSNAGVFKGNGNAVTPDLVVMAGKIKLNPADYTASYSNNTAVGTARVIVTSNSPNYRDKTIAGLGTTFKITKGNMAKLELVGISDQTYTGKNIEFSDIRIKDNTGYIGDNIVGDDSYIITYAKNLNAGTATVSIKAKATSIYTGTVNKNFKINPIDVNNAVERSRWKLYDTYTGEAVEFSSEELGNKFVKKGTRLLLDPTFVSPDEFDISYENNINVGSDAKIVLKGKGNYTGTAKFSFTINPKEMSNFYVSIDKTVDVPDGWVSGVAVPTTINTVKTSLLGKTLKEGVDYTVIYSNNTEKGLARVCIQLIGNYSGSKTLYYTIK